MKALVYHGPGQKAWEEAPDPTIVDPTDVIVQVDTTTICGTDLHILKGDVPAVTDGRILGHEGVGTITEVGQAVSKLAVGDRVIISCIPRAAHAPTATSSCPRIVWTRRGRRASAGSSATSSMAPRRSTCGCPSLTAPCTSCLRV
jgi:threonine dehydrogenase-like Zn-dependent dehydrogenase